LEALTIKVIENAKRASQNDITSYGKPGIGASCGGFSEGGVIGFGDVGNIGFGVGTGTELGVAVVVVTFFIVFGIPHKCDSVVLTKVSFGLLGSHIFDFSAGVIVVVLVGDCLVGEEGGGEVDGNEVAGGVFCSICAWLPLIIPISNTALIIAIAASTTAVKLILIDIFNVLNIDLRLHYRLMQCIFG
jgi:hypothetical protein